MRHTQRSFILIAASTAFIASSASAETFNVTPSDDWRGVMTSLQAGDVMVFGEGTYSTNTDFVVNLLGTADQPIEVRGADGVIAIIEGVDDKNIIDLSGTYFTLRNLEFSGGSHGIRLATTSNAVFEDLYVHDTRDVGISCNRGGNSCDRLVFRRVEIARSGLAGGEGEGMYLGCNADACRITNSTIEQCFIHDTDSGNQGDGIDMKVGWSASLAQLGDLESADRLGDDAQRVLQPTRDATLLEAASQYDAIRAASREGRLDDTDAPRPEIYSVSDDVRLAARLRAAHEERWSRRHEAWLVRPRGAGFRPPGQTAFTSIENRQPLASILARLLRQRLTSTDGLERHELIEAGWPNERLTPGSARNRLNVALSTLRKLGLADLLDHTTTGHRLDPNALVIAAP